MLAIQTAAALQTACRWILNEPRLSAPEKTLCLTIAADLAETPPVYPTVDLLARQLQYCEKSVRKHLKHLEGLGIVAKINSFLPDLQKKATIVSLTLPVAPGPEKNSPKSALSTTPSAEGKDLPSRRPLPPSSHAALASSAFDSATSPRQPASIATDPGITERPRRGSRVASPAPTGAPAPRGSAEIPPAPSRLPGKVLMLYDTTCIDLPPAGPITTAIEWAVSEMVATFPQACYLSWWENYFRKMTDPDLIAYLRGTGHTLNLTWLLVPENARMILDHP